MMTQKVGLILREHMYMNKKHKLPEAATRKPRPEATQVLSSLSGQQERLPVSPCAAKWGWGLGMKLRSLRP